MAELELALAASSRGWADSLHRFLADHGGARVRTVVMGPDDVVSESYDVLLIDDVCSFLTPRLVEQARRHGRLVVGVFDGRDGTDAKRRLLECGVDDVVEADATPDEFLEAIGRVRQLVPTYPELIPERVGPSAAGEVIAVGSPPGGCGSTEVALALGAHLGAVVVDADDVAPSLAQRVGAPLHPNLRTAIDVIHHHGGEVEGLLTASDGVELVAGLAHGDDWAQLHPGEVEAVVAELATVRPRIVANVGAGLERPLLGEGRFGLARAVVAGARKIVGVGLPTPVGVTRLVRWLHEARVLAPEAQVIAVVNRVDRSPFRRGEIESEIQRAVPGLPVAFLPEDPRVTEAAWAGGQVKRGPFRRSIARLSAELTA
ncbi:MAG TPA: hypothetical protein VJ938_00450 [Acidimicrobiia bacterium]|nr:hypothetical protein [Acidimicrobiia bacterium]